MMSRENLHGGLRLLNINLLKLIIMVTVVGFKEIQTEDGREFVSVELQGEPKLEISATTGNFYLTANKTRVSTAFSAEA
jgi:hypothetical protein